jgi:hypothetical protein
MYRVGPPSVSGTGTETGTAGTGPFALPELEQECITNLVPDPIPGTLTFLDLEFGSGSDINN